ncbi:MAG: hypothetical protein WBR18_09540 [Anaerolineales bacterium]
MRLFTNESRIQRNHNTGRFLVFSGLALLAGGFIYSLRHQDEVSLVLMVAILGTLTSQFGIAMLNRWGKSPREDQQIDAALKGLNDDWALLHYAGPTNHILIGPAGCLALVPRDEQGSVTLEDGEWINDSPPRGLLRRGGRGQMRGLERGAQQASGNLQSFLDAHFEAAAEEKYTAEPLLIFMSDEVDLDVDADLAPIPAVHYKKVKGWLRRQPREKAPDPQDAAALAEQIGLVHPSDQ